MASSVMGAQGEGRQGVPASFSVTDALLLCMALIWGINFIVVKYATGHFEPLAFNSTRIALAVAVLWGIVLARRLPLPSRRDAASLMMLGVLGNGVYQILWIEGIARTRASDAALLVASSPAFIEVIGSLRGHDRIGHRGIAGIALSLVGIGLVVNASGADGTSTFLGNALILLSCLAWAVYSVFLQPFATRFDGITLSALTMAGGLAPIVIFGAPALARTQWSGVGASAWAAVVYAGVFALVIAYLFWYRGVRVLGPTRTAMYSNLQPLVAMIAAWAFLSETPRGGQVLGAAFIIGGLVLARMTRRRATVAHE